MILNAWVIGGVQAIDGGEADNKIIAILENDKFWAGTEDISQVPDVLVNRLQYYFSTYKMAPGGEKQMVIEKIFDRAYALDVVIAAMEDYEEMYGR